MYFSLRNSDNHFTLEGQGSLRIDGVQGKDEGEYTCRAINAEDSVDEAVMLTVQGEFLIQSVIVSVILINCQSDSALRGIFSTM